MIGAGYWLDYSSGIQKIRSVIGAAGMTAALTVIGALAAPDMISQEGNQNKSKANAVVIMALMIGIKVLQGGMTAILAPGFNGITLGIVGSKGFTRQVSRNRMMTHTGTAVMVSMGSIVAYALYPALGVLFFSAPICAYGVYYFLNQIIPAHIDQDAARSLKLESNTMSEYELADAVAFAKQQAARIQWECNSSSGTSPVYCAARSSSSSSSAEEPVFASSPYYPFGNELMPPPSETAAPRRSSAVRTYEGNMGGANSPGEDHTARYPQAIDERLNSTAITADAFATILDAKQNTEFFDNESSSARQSVPTKETKDMLRSTGDKGKEQGSRRAYSTIPSFNWGWGEILRQEGSLSSSLDYNELDPCRLGDSKEIQKIPTAQTPLSVVFNPKFLVFCTVVFFFHAANASVLPLVMQSLSLQDPQYGILLSGLCIVIAQSFMTFFAQICGDYSPVWGRKGLILGGIAALSVRCFLLTILVSAQDGYDDESTPKSLKMYILLTQLLDSAGGGIVGTMQVLVTSDISAGTGRFSLLVGITASSMCLGATVSSYLGQAIAFDYGYPNAFAFLGLLSLLPFCLYLVLMPETLPESARPPPKRKQQKRVQEMFQRKTDSRHSIPILSTPQRKSWDPHGIENLEII